jgi:hypothetical protein
MFSLIPCASASSAAKSKQSSYRTASYFVVVEVEAVVVAVVAASPPFPLLGRHSHQIPDQGSLPKLKRPESGHGSHIRGIIADRCSCDEALPLLS